MVDLSIYFSPIKSEIKDFGSETLGEKIMKHDETGFPEIEKDGMAIVHVPEYRRSTIDSTVINEEFRNQLYELHVGDNWTKGIYDLGTILPGNNIEDTVYAVSQVVSELIKIDVIPIIIGGGQDMTLACYKGFEVLEQTINICAIDHKLDIGEPTEEAKSDGFVSHLLMQRPCYLFNYSNIGMQRPKVKAKEVDLFEKLYFDVCRLGEFNTDIRRAEPHLRNADILSIDFNSINSAYTDQAQYTNPNGFRSDQICQIANYAGMSDKMSCFGVFEIQPEQSEKASQLLAEMIWYFADGVSKRVGDFPIGSKKNYKKFHVHLDDFDDDLVFYKSDRSERWWLEISHSQGTQSKYLRHHMVPCDLSDYENAMENVIPNLWWKTLQKIE